MVTPSGHLRGFLGPGLASLTSPAIRARRVLPSTAVPIGTPAGPRRRHQAADESSAHVHHLLPQQGGTAPAREGPRA